MLFGLRETTEPLRVVATFAGFKCGHVTMRYSRQRDLWPMPRHSAGCLRLTRQMLQPGGLLTRHRLARRKHPARGVPPARHPRLEICSDRCLRMPSGRATIVRGPHYTHVYLLHAVYCQTLLASQLDFVT
jgi:hypothetical protein